MSRSTDRSTDTEQRGTGAIAERTEKGATIAFLRILIGLLWLFEVTVGHNWKIGGFGSGANPGWIGPGAGDTVREEIGLAVEDGTWAWVGWLYETVIVPNATAFSYFVVVLQLAFGLFFIFGFMVRPMALIALAMDLSIFFLGNSRIPPFFSVAHLFLLSTGAGRYYGLDGWISGRLGDARSGFARLVRWVIDLPVLRSARLQSVLLAATVGLATYFFTQTVMRDTSRMGMVAMDLAVLFGLVAAGIFYGRQEGDPIGVVAALMRIFVGYKLLHEIWVRVDPGVNALPGWAGTEAQREVFDTVRVEHWAPFSWLAEYVVLPAMGFWVVVFGVVQFAVGVMLVLGYWTRLAAVVALMYVGGLIVLGQTRYAPFIFGLLVVVLALDAGRHLGFDRRSAQDREPRYGLPIPRRAVPVLVVVAAVNFVAAAVAVVATGGVAPAGYVESMGQMTTAMVAIYSGLFGLIGWLQLRSARGARKVASRSAASPAASRSSE